MFTRHDRTDADYNLTQFCGLQSNYEVFNYNQFSDSKYDVVINCVGISDPAKITSENTWKDTTFGSCELKSLTKPKEIKIEK